MKKIILLGDSIRMGYDKYVKEALADTAEVYYPAENCRFAQYMLRFLHAWKETNNWPEDADLVHWNAGLWDVSETYGDPPISSLAHYTDMIARIDKRIRLLFPKAKVVFATTVPILEDGAAGDNTGVQGTINYSNEWVKTYNAAAVKLMEELEVPVNDLYALCMEDDRRYKCEDLLHLSEEGSRRCAAQVADYVRKYAE